jgi:preprotein translocase subunit SecG
MIQYWENLLNQMMMVIIIVMIIVIIVVDYCGSTPQMQIFCFW